MRNQALAQIHAAIAGPKGALEDYISAAAGWVVVPITSRGEIIGGVLIRHNELHVGVTRTPDASMRSLVRSVLQKTIKSYGRALTTCWRKNPQGVRFCVRLGFTVEWEDEETLQLQCRSVRHV